MSGILIIVGRVLGLAAALFVGMFALDAFSADAPWWQNLVGFVIHLTPALALLAILAVSWRWPLVGGGLFLLAAVAPFALLFNPVRINLLLATPPAAAGALLIVGALFAMRG